jgi:hypothetical protein
MKKPFKNIIEEIKIFAIDNIKSGTSKAYFSDKFYYFIEKLENTDGFEKEQNKNITSFEFENGKYLISFYDTDKIKEIKVDFGVNGDLTDFSVEKYFK